MQATTNEIIQTVIGYQFDRVDSDRYQTVSQDILAKLFFDQFVFPGFSKLLSAPETIDFNRVYDTVKTDPISFSAFVFKIVAVLDAKGMAKEAIILLNHLLESYCNQQLLDRGFVIIKFVFYMATKHSFADINEGYYQQLMEQILEALPGLQQQLDNAARLTVAKYEHILGLETFFLTKVTIPDAHLKLLRRTFDLTYQFPDERFKKLDDFTVSCLMFDNPDLYDYPAQAERRLLTRRLSKAMRPILRHWKSDIEVRKSYVGANSRYFVLKFNFKSNSHKFRYLIVRPDRLAVVNKKKISSISNFKQKGVCGITRPRGQRARRRFRPLRKKDLGLQTPAPRRVQRVPDSVHLRQRKGAAF